MNREVTAFRSHLSLIDSRDELAAQVLEWYGRNGRELPWRRGRVEISDGCNLKAWENFPSQPPNGRLPGSSARRSEKKQNQPRAGRSRKRRSHERLATEE